MSNSSSNLDKDSITLQALSLIPSKTKKPAGVLPAGHNQKYKQQRKVL